MASIFITGGTGYIGRRLIPALINEGHQVSALVRKGSEHKLVGDCKHVAGNALDSGSYAPAVKGHDIFIHLVGVAHPSPSKKDLFRSIDLASAKEACRTATGAGIRKFIYLSVAAEPTSIMKDYQETRREAEAFIRASGINYVFLRPWYVIGPGHYWPLFFLPLFKLLELIPGTSARAKALRLVYLPQLIRALINAVNEQSRNRIMEIAEIRKS